MTFTVRWPDGRVDDCYSPSLVMHDHLDVGATYTVEDFVNRAAIALDQASERVRARFGFACSASAASSERVRLTGALFEPTETVQVLRMQPPLPEESS
ncbi:MAG: MSMEG_0570 family nitrogen starvation response protein [Propionibacteriales bacterium]|nr:MSMEG_0570 family nitrogen starvation response protein [Propionibacteriales bacterium]